MTKILFSNFPWFEGANSEIFGVRAGSRWPHTFQSGNKPDKFRFGEYAPIPFFMCYAASYARRHLGCKVIVRDSIALRESYASYYRALQAIEPDYIVIETATPSWDHDSAVIAKISQLLPNARLILTGTISETDPLQIIDEFGLTAIIRGEYEKGVVAAVNGARGLVEHRLLTVQEMNEAPFPDYPSDTWAHYCDHNPHGQKFPHAQVWASRGCPFKCAAGDTQVNTVYGKIPIRNLAEQYAKDGKEVPVWSFDPITKEGKLCSARNILKLGENEKLVRVNFDDGTHIDLTPDHKLLAFKWGNQFTGEKQWACEAQHLEPGMHIRAIRERMSGPKKSAYLQMEWSRRGREKKHRMIMEWRLGRRLVDGEIVHHKDENRLNNHPDNLELCASTKEHFDKHPEISERMRLNNPTRNGVSDEWRANMRAGHARGKIVNHRVVSVEPLPGLHDVYCLEVPDTNWFYANDVLIRNCIFCVWPAVMTGNDPNGDQKRSVRHYTPEYMVAWLTELTGRYPFRSIYFDDDTFNLGNPHTLRMCEVMRKISLPWSAMCRADTIKRETWNEMKDSGCFGVKLGFESGNQWVVDNIVNKHLDLAEAAETVRHLKRIGMTVHGTFTVGLPGETREQVQDTMRFIDSLPLDSHQLSGTAEIEGTPLANLRRDGHLDAYAGAVADDRYVIEPDGGKKAQEIISQLRA